MTIAENLAAVRKRIDSAAARAGRDPATITLVAVSKTFGLDVIEDAIEAGISDLGENRAQEFKQKVAIAGSRARWHFIGHLQTNKVRSVVGASCLIHSVDRVGLAEAIARRATTLGVTQDVLIEVNVARDPKKFGIEPTGLRALVADIAALDSLRVQGLMTMAPFADDPEDSRPFFNELAQLAAEVEVETTRPVELSMGMTRDFEVAIEEGATIVRVGEAIFGPRIQRTLRKLSG